jgi:hypothetical protein
MTTPAKKTRRDNKGFTDPGVVLAADRCDAFTKSRKSLDKKPTFYGSCDYKHKEGLLALAVHANRAKFKLVCALAGLMMVMMGSPPAQAEEPKNSLHILCCSYHHNRDVQNELHAGVFYSRDISDRWSLGGGTFTNSAGNRSWMAGVRYEMSVFDNWDVALTAGPITGYSFPVGILPSLEYRDTVTLYAIPGHVYAIGFTILRW